MLIVTEQSVWRQVVAQWQNTIFGWKRLQIQSLVSLSRAFLVMVSITELNGLTQLKAAS